MGKGSKAPEAPDAYKTASAESQFNRLNTYSPSGSGTRYGYTDASGNFVSGMAPKGFQSAVKSIESPWEQQIREALQPASVDLTKRVISDNITGMPDAARVKDRSDVARDVFDRSFSLMAPAMEKSQSRLLTNLQSRGIPMGGAAFNESYGDQLTRTQDTISRLAQDANIAAGQEQSRQFSLDSAARQGSISELVAAMGGGYNPPSAVPSGNAAGVNYGGLVGQQYQNDLAAYNTAQANKAQTAGALGSLGGAMLMKCTETAKQDFTEFNLFAAVGALRQIPLYLWKYQEGQRPPGDHGGQHIGPTAEDFQKFTGLGRSDRIDAVDFFGTLAAAMQAMIQTVDALVARADAADRRSAQLENLCKSILGEPLTVTETARVN
ncbi:MAG: hypothetical protein RL268_2024 [Pseudomonadota bacterium]|jgi:hypothetical protein